jgi:transmembrane sensor
MSNGESRVRVLITEAAAEWYVTNRQGLDEPQRRQFLSWIKESPVHVEEYLSVTQLSQDLKETFGHPDFSIDSLLERARKEETNVESVFPLPPRVTPPRSPPWVSRWALGAAATAMMTAVIAVFYLWPSTTPTPVRAEKPLIVRFATRHGEVLTRQLPDASVLHLDTDTAVTIRYSPGERRVDLEQGQAVFEVRHDSARPFHVVAGSAEIVDIGTTFNVYLHPDSTLVTVIEGEVIVSSLKAPANGGTTKLSIGQQVRVVPGRAPTLPTLVDARRSSDWMKRQIAFKKEPLEHVAAEFNRYAATPIEIKTPALQRLPISGVFRTDDTESFLAFLHTLDQVRVTTTPTHIEVEGP